MSIHRTKQTLVIYEELAPHLTVSIVMHRVNIYLPLILPGLYNQLLVPLTANHLIFFLNLTFSIIQRPSVTAK